MVDIDPVGSLSVLLTSGCNLDCRYCYRQAGPARRLDWGDLRRSLDWALAAPGGELELIFSGGEPLLEFDLLSRAISHVRSNGRSGRPVELRILTNGILLDPDRLEFLDHHSVFVNLSFDGVGEAQIHRGEGTWDKLDRLLGLMKDQHDQWFSDYCRVTMTLTPQNLPYLADSVEYLVDRKVEAIGVSPALSRVPGWDDDLLPPLDRQFSRIFDHGKRHLQKTGKVPFLAFRKYLEDDIPPEPGKRSCAALAGHNPVLDVDGHLYSCLMFAPSGMDTSDRRLKEIAEDIDLGQPDDPEFEDKRRSFTGGIRNSELFSSAPDLESRYGKCRECPAAAVCKICPLALLESGPGKAPKKVPALLCAYNLLSIRYRGNFPVQENPYPPPVTVESIKERMRYWEKVHK
ncbi:MAG: radical SAM protein [Candidatus Krumholzibacteriota bacterium]